jgi:hypothetical protein
VEGWQRYENGGLRLIGLLAHNVSHFTDGDQSRDRDDRLLNEALWLGGHRTKKETVTEALREYVQRRRQLRAIDLFGKIDFDPSYDYKKYRNKP